MGLEMPLGRVSAGDICRMTKSVYSRCWTSCLHRDTPNGTGHCWPERRCFRLISFKRYCIAMAFNFNGGGVAIGTVPEFTEKAADVVGLHLHPPENVNFRTCSRTR